MDYINQAPGKQTSTLTPDKIVSTLFSMYNIAHVYHLQTQSYAKHMMLKEVYEGLGEFKDSISEFLLGIQAPKRLGNITLAPIPGYSDGSVEKFLHQGCEFTKQLCAYAESIDYEQLCNLSSELQGLFTKAVYLNTLK